MHPTGKRVILDTNILLLLVIGTVARDHIERFRRTRDRFEREDFDLLSDSLRHFSTLVTTPHVLTETSNLISSLHEPYLSEARRVLASFITAAEEEHTASKSLVGHHAYALFGLTDTGLADAARGGTVVLTDDAPLHAFLVGIGAETWNFNHLRD